MTIEKSGLAAVYLAAQQGSSVDGARKEDAAQHPAVKTVETTASPQARLKAAVARLSGVAPRQAIETDASPQGRLSAEVERQIALSGGAGASADDIAQHPAVETAASPQARLKAAVARLVATGYQAQ